MVALLAVLFGGLAALLGAAATVGWQRAGRAQDEARRRRHVRAARRVIVDVVTVAPRSPRTGTLISRR